MKCCMTVWICSYLVKSKTSQPPGHSGAVDALFFYAVQYPTDFRCIQVFTSALVGCARCTLGFRFPKKYAHQNDPLNQGNLHELKLRLKIVRYPGIEVDKLGLDFESVNISRSKQDSLPGESNCLRLQRSCQLTI